MTENESRRQLLGSAALVGALTGCSRLLGFVREILMAAFFGTTLAKAAFDVAFRLPNLFRRLFGEGALSAAFVPVFSKSLQNEGRERANLLGGRMVSLMSIVLGTLVVLGVLLLSIANPWVPEGSRAAQVIPLMRTMLPYTLFICLVALCMGMLNAAGHFAVPALTPVLLNLIWIGTLVLVCPLLPASLDVRVQAVAFGVLVAGVVQLAVQIPVLLRLRIKPWPRRGSLGDQRVRRVLALMAPAAAGLGIVQFNVFMDGVLALIAAPWAPAALTYAERLVYLPLGVFATALGTVLLPTFSKQAGRGDQGALKNTVRDAFSNMLIIMVPAAFGLVALAGPIVKMCYMRGQFDAESAVQTTRALVSYAPGLIVFSLYKVVAPVFYAHEDTRTPVRVAVWMAVLNFALNLLSILLLPVDFRHCGMAAATVFCSGLSCVILGVVLHRRWGSPGWGHIFGVACKTVLAACVMVGVVLALYFKCAAAVPGHWRSDVALVLCTTASVVCGMAVYGVLVTLLLGRRAMARLIHRRR